MVLTASTLASEMTTESMYVKCLSKPGQGQDFISVSFTLNRDWTGQSQDFVSFMLKWGLAGVSKWVF